MDTLESEQGAALKKHSSSPAGIEFGPYTYISQVTTFSIVDEGLELLSGSKHCVCESDRISHHVLGDCGRKGQEGAFEFRITETKAPSDVYCTAFPSLSTKRHSLTTMLFLLTACFQLSPRDDFQLSPRGNFQLAPSKAVTCYLAQSTQGEASTRGSIF